MFNLKVFIMKFESKVFKTTPLSAILELKSVLDKKGNVFYMVTTFNANKASNYCFRHLSSAIDFIESNFV